MRRHRAKIQSQAHVGVEQNASSQLCFARSAKSAVNTFYVCFVLFLCFFPYFTTAFVIQLTGSSLTKYIILQYTGTITFLNSSLNPLVYFWRIGEIRVAIKNTLKIFESREVRREQSEENDVWVGVPLLINYLKGRVLSTLQLFAKTTSYDINYRILFINTGHYGLVAGITWQTFNWHALIHVWVGYVENSRITYWNLTILVICQFRYRSFSRDVIAFYNPKLKSHQSFYPHEV